MLTLDLARELIAAAENEARSQGFDLSFAVVDAARMDGADWITPEVAFGKAWTAAAFRSPSAAQGEKAQKLVAFAGAISSATDGRYTPQIGGLPFEIDGAAAGAIGASGAQGHEDEAVVRSAIERVLGGH
jgi:uncharacterized protein GlcG (DUF336 family)